MSRRLGSMPSGTSCREAVMSDPQILIFDTGPLVHFAREGWLGPLRAVVGGRRALIPDVVADELRVFAAGESRVLPVLESPCRALCLSAMTRCG